MATRTQNASTETGAARPPRDDLFRAILPGVALREAGIAGRPTMFGHFSVFDEWAEIDSAYEGHFLERVAAGAFAKTMAENRGNMKVLFHHGRDQLGVQVLGTIDELCEDDRGAYYEVGLFAGIPPLVMDGLRAGEYGASYRFKVMHEEYVQRPRKSAHNPRGLPERTIVEAKVREFGPTPFPAFDGASSGVRSLTDDILFDRFAEDPERLERLVRRSGISLSGLNERDQRENRLYERSVEYIGESVWAVHPGTLATIVEVIRDRRAGVKIDDDEIKRRISAQSPLDDLDDDLDDEDAEPDPVDPNESVAVLQLYGAIVPHATMFSRVSGACSVEDFTDQFRTALADESKQAILIDINSPGGAVQLVPELAAEILAARGAKPIVAMVNAFAASAAYWIATACDEIVVTPSGQVGSIGVYVAHDDLSVAQEKMGIKTTLVSAGKYKTEGNPFEPLTPEAEAELQAKVDAYYQMFIQAVAAGRGVKTDDVAAGFGQGRMVLAADSIEANMADRVATYDDTLARLATPAVTRSEPEATPTTRTPGTEPEPSVATTRDNSRRLYPGLNAKPKGHVNGHLE